MSGTRGASRTRNARSTILLRRPAGHPSGNVLARGRGSDSHPKRQSTLPLASTSTDTRPPILLPASTPACCATRETSRSSLRSTKEVPCRIVVERTLPPKDDFRDYFDCYTICNSFTTQDASFARVHIALEKSDAFTLFLLKVRSCDMSRMASVSVASVKPVVAPSGSNQIGHASGSAPGWSRSKKVAGSSSVSLAHPPRLPKIVPPPPGWNWDLRRPGDDNSAQACGSFLRPRHSRLCDRQIYADCSMV